MTNQEAMKMAIEALKKFVSTEWTEPFAEYRYDSDTPSENQFRDEVFTAIKAIEEALANADADAEIIKYHEATIARLQKAAKQEQGDPVAKLFGTLPVYDTTTQQRKPLTEEQLIDLWPSIIMHQHTYAFARAIEAAHGIKD